MIIYKYPIPVQPEFIIDIPRGSNILSFQLQKDEPTIWCSVHPENEYIPYHFRLIGTGHEFNKDEVLTFIGTIQINNLGNAPLCNPLVLHLFHGIGISNET